MAVLCNVNASDLVSTELVIKERFHFLLGLGVKHPDIARRVAYEDEIPKQVDATHHSVILMVWLIKQLLLDLVELRLDDELLIHVVVFLLERQQLACLL